MNRRPKITSHFADHRSSKIYKEKLPLVVTLEKDDDQKITIKSYYRGDLKNIIPDISDIDIDSLRNRILVKTSKTVIEDSSNIYIVKPGLVTQKVDRNELRKTEDSEKDIERQDPTINSPIIPDIGIDR